MANSTDKSILTAAGKALLAQLNAEEKALVIDKMIFANVPNRPEYPQPDDVVPTDHIVHQEQVEQRGRLSADSVIYSTTLTSDVGPFDFNWTGAYCSEYGVLVTIDHHALTPKTADEPGVAGNTLVRSVVLEYKDIAEITNITVDASTWQYDSRKRLEKMDVDSAQAIVDQNGKDWFIDSSFQVIPNGGSFNIKNGVGYVSGLRVSMEFDRNIQVSSKPSYVYIDAYRGGAPTGEQVVSFEFFISSQEKDDYVDKSTGKEIKHYLCKIAKVHEDGTVSDLRPEQSKADKNWTTSTFPRVISDVISLKAYSGLVDGQQIELLGYYEEGDGGGGSLIWSSDIDIPTDNAIVFEAEGGAWVRRNKTITPVQAGWKADKNGPQRIRELLNLGVSFAKPSRLTSLQGQAARWAAGLKAPIGFYGDSTTDGRITTIDGINLATKWNIDRLVSNAVPDGLVYDHDDREVPNAYPNIMQRMLREFHNNTLIRVYNAGYRGKQAQDGWAVNNVHNAVYGNKTYSDVEWIGIMFGLNDSNASSDPKLLERRTYIENQALIIDAFARGVQPALMSCPPSNNTATSGDYGNNNEVNELVDQVKRRLANEYGIEFIDVNKAIKHWIYNNGDKIAFAEASSDGLHLNDIGHLKKAEFLFKTAEQDNVPSLVNERHCFDVVHSAMRYALSRNDISSGEPLRGANKLYQNGVIQQNDIEKVLGKNVVDLWVWNECRDHSLVYRAYKSNAVAFGEANREDLLHVVLESQLFTAEDFHKTTIFNSPTPESIGYVGSGRADFPCFVGKLKYGLNRIRIYVPSTAGNLFSSGVVQTYLTVGWFDFISNRQENRYPVMHYNYGFTYMDRAHWRDVIAGRGRVVHPPISSNTPNSFVRNITSPSLEGYNSYSLSQPGDVVEFRFEANFPSGTGVVLSWNKCDDYGIYPDGYDKNSMYSSGGIFMFYANISETPLVRFAYLNPENEGVPSIPLFETGVDISEIQNKTLIVRMQLLDTYQIHVTLLTADLTQLFEGTITDQNVLGEIATAYCGGSFSNGSSAKGTFELEYLQLREYRV
ncbi:phage tail protein [Vibrio sp. 779(2023)]|uniref:phage tail-collar fiber domain-containing protein n=1 Tax=Vibrio sp. 779(2023) TaxID=3074712 RepID=UPI002966E6EC|nr:phage tail protein [Vibrio sp. 779(2023)]MDW3154485.1 phage tail protein [Vibrio sp. 779(2023)]